MLRVNRLATKSEGSMQLGAELQNPASPDWKEIVCGICWKSVMGHSLEELRHCAIRSGRRMGESERYFLPAHLCVHVENTEAKSQSLDIESWLDVYRKAHPHARG